MRRLQRGARRGACSPYARTIRPHRRSALVAGTMANCRSTLERVSGAKIIVLPYVHNRALPHPVPRRGTLVTPGGVTRSPARLDLAPVLKAEQESARRASSSRQQQQQRSGHLVETQAHASSEARASVRRLRRPLRGLVPSPAVDAPRVRPSVRPPARIAVVVLL